MQYPAHHCTALHTTALHCTVLHCTAQPAALFSGFAAPRHVHPLSLSPSSIFGPNYNTILCPAHLAAVLLYLLYGPSDLIRLVESGFSHSFHNSLPQPQCKIWSVSKSIQQFCMFFYLAKPGFPSIIQTYFMPWKSGNTTQNICRSLHSMTHQVF